MRGYILCPLLCLSGFTHLPPPHWGESSLDEAAAVRPSSVTGLSLQGGSLQEAPVLLKVLEFLVIHLFFLRSRGKTKRNAQYLTEITRIICCSAVKLLLMNNIVLF